MRQRPFAILSGGRNEKYGALLYPDGPNLPFEHVMLLRCVTASLSENRSANLARGTSTRKISLVEARNLRPPPTTPGAARIGRWSSSGRDCPGSRSCPAGKSLNISPSRAATSTALSDGFL